MKQRLIWLGLIAFPILAIGGVHVMKRNTGVRNFEWPTQMQYSAAFRSQTANPVLANGMTAQSVVAGTAPRGFHPFHYGPQPAEAERAGRELKNPFQPTPENLARGQQIFANYCQVCHGATGAGDGPLIPKYPNPPAYQTDASKALPDGNLFHVITMGRNNMPSHAAQVAADDRWKVILYIRKLQGKN
ncbi:MAG TPA: cytochrome c [Pyrinomonadaceae bacterium]|nr:cytochrome c [Pyrinomonadaceae bacterium]